MAPPWIIVADDLTGAADSAIAFARRRVPARVIWGDSLPLVHADAMVLAYDAATRELDAAPPRAATGKCCTAPAFARAVVQEN